MSAAEWLDGVRDDLEAATDDIGVVYDMRGDEWVLTMDKSTMWTLRRAPDRLDRMERALRGVMEAHAPFRIYELEADGTPKCWNGDESVLATCCESCTPDDTIEAAGDGEWTEDMPYVPWPCPTVATIREALG